MPARSSSSTHQPQDSNGQHGRCDDGPDHPADESGLEVLDFGADTGDFGRQPRVEVRDFGPDLGEAGLELVRGDVVAVFEVVVDGLGDDLSLIAVRTWRSRSSSSRLAWCLVVRHIKTCG